MASPAANMPHETPVHWSKTIKNSTFKHCNESEQKHQAPFISNTQNPFQRTWSQGVMAVASLPPTSKGCIQMTQSCALSSISTATSPSTDKRM